MEHSNFYSPDGPMLPSHSTASSVDLASPTVSLFSKGHSSKGSSSSISSSSPILRDSLDMYGATKRLEDVTEEPQERDEFAGYTLVNDNDTPYNFADYDKAFGIHHTHLSPPVSPAQPEWTLGDTDNWSLPLLDQHHSKRPRSMDQAPQAAPQRAHTRFGSLSRHWRNRSAAGPQLTIITHLGTPATRSRSLTGPQIWSPALSAISKHESLLPRSPTQASAMSAASASQTSLDFTTQAIDIEQKPAEQEDEQQQATTPLLPPVLSELLQRESPVHSPLQSPSIAPTSAVMSPQTSFDVPLTSYLPSPPLSSKPSRASMQTRSRASTITGDIPPMQLLDDTRDPWDVKLGHANFSIHPEPYVPETLNLDSYTEFRNNWKQARTHYAKHVARTAEHYGSTSKVYRLTEEKWTLIDNQWKRQYQTMKKALAPVLIRLSDPDSDTPDSASSSAVLEKLPTRVILPVIDDKTGKFPELGDMEIVGPMSVAPPRVVTVASKGTDVRSPPPSPHKRNPFKFILEALRS